MGAVLQQKTDEGWQAIHFASRFITTFEQKYSINELELLALVWAVENFRNYVYGSFEIVSDHKALISILKGNRANKTFSSRLTRWVNRLLPVQFTVSHEPGRTLGMADFLSRHPSPSNNNEQLKAEELLNNWLTVNEDDVNKPVLVEQNNRDKQSVTNDLANRSETARCGEAESENKLSKQCEQTIKSIIASINTSVSTSKIDSSDSASYAASTIEFASTPPMKTPMCYSINQIEILQTLGNYTLAAHFESDEFLQKIVNLIQKPDSTKINRLPAPWREQFKCLILDKHDYPYMDERLVVPKVLRPIIFASLHYGNPGRDSMLSTVSNVVATSPPRGGRNCKNLPSMSNCR